MSAVFTELERHTRVALLGVRFWDRPTARPVWDGLRVTELGAGRPAVANRSGVFVVHDLPGLSDAEAGAGDAAYWASPPGRRAATFSVADELGRFHDFVFDATAPFRGLFDLECGHEGSPPVAGPLAVPLFSLPSRPLPAGTAAVRAELVDAETGAPAAWAVLEVRAPGVAPARGIADRMGRVLVPLAYPEPPSHGSSPPAGSRPLSSQTWTVELAVRYSPRAATPPPPGPADPGPPDLCTVLTQLPAVVAGGESPAVPLETSELAFGRDLVLNDPQRTLLVTPAA